MPASRSGPRPEKAAREEMAEKIVDVEEASEGSRGGGVKDSLRKRKGDVVSLVWGKDADEDPTCSKTLALSMRLQQRLVSASSKSVLKYAVSRVVRAESGCENRRIRSGARERRRSIGKGARQREVAAERTIWVLSRIAPRSW
jgi:hypothetical protein